MSLDLAPARTLLARLHQSTEERDEMGRAANACIALLIADVERLERENSRLRTTIARLRRESGRAPAPRKATP